MRRKLVKQAEQALTITLPIDWIRKNGLKSGDEIDLEIRENEIFLKSGKKTKGGSVKLKTTDFDSRMYLMFINSIYAKGIDEIEIDSERELYQYIQQAIGYAIVSQKGNRYVVRDISGVSTESLDDIFKRLFQMIISFYDAAINDIFGTSNETIENLNKRDSEVNRFVLFLQRSINKLSYPDPLHGKILFTYSFALEQISDEILRLWRTNIQYKIKKSNRLKKIIEMSREALGLAFEIYYRLAPEKIDDLNKLKESIRKKSLELNKTDTSIARFIMYAIKIAEDSADLTHLSLMKHEGFDD